MGSGTTAEVALATGRQVIGFELDSRYIEIAARRLDAFEEWRDAYRTQQLLPIFEEQPKLATFDFG